MAQGLFKFNTVVLYGLVFLIAGVLLFSYIRIFYKRIKLARGSDEDACFEKLDRGSRQKRLKALLKEFENLQKALEQLDVELLRLSSEDYISVVMMQEWCCEDKKGKETQPCRTRPSTIKIKWTNGNKTIDLSPYINRQFLTGEENKLLFWGIGDRCRLMIPFRNYRSEVKRTTRTFKVENNVKVWWEEDTVIKEDYCMEIW